jgi:hypothetical protein
MKRNLLYTLVFLTWTGTAICQSIPFPLENAAWKEDHITIAGPILHHIALCGDTLIDGKTYSRVFDLGIDTSGAVIGKAYLGGIRSEDNRVLYLPNFPFDEHVLYDFNLETGDVIDLYPLYSNQTESRTVDSVKMEMIAGKIRKVIYFKPDPWDPGPEFWMEGIGSSYGLLGRASPTCCDIGFILLCFRHEDEYLNLTTSACELSSLAANCSSTNASRSVEGKALAWHATPNPFIHETIITLPEDQVLISPWEVKIYTQTGRLVRSVPGGDNNKVRFSAIGISPGMYHAVIEETSTGRLLGRLKLVVR